MIIDAHVHLWRKQAGLVDGMPVYPLENGRAMLKGEVRQMLPPYMTDNKNTAAALDHLDRRIILADWQYSYGGGFNPTTKYFMERGFDTVVCPWDGHENIRSLAADAKKLGAYGILLTTWDHLPNWLRDASFAAGCVWGEGEASPPHPITESAYLLRTLYDTEGRYESSGWNLNEVLQ